MRRGGFSCTRGAGSGQYGDMNRVLDQLTDIRTAADRQLLDRFLTARDDSD